MPAPTCKPDFDSAAKRFEAWWAGQSLGRPVVLAAVPKPDAPPEPADERPRAVQEADPAWHVRLLAHKLDSTDFLAESVPGVCPYYGNNLVIPAVLAGATLEYRPDTTWIQPIADIYDRPVPEFSAAHPAYRLMERIVRAQAEALGDRGLLSCPPLLDGLTTLSMFREPQPLCLDLIERPEDVKRTAMALDRLGRDFHTALFGVLESLGHGQSVTWAGLYAPGKAEMVQCDFAVMLSPAMFGEFVVPVLAAATEYFDRSCYHLDGTGQTRFLDHLCSLPRLNAIQWNPEPPAAPPLAWVDFFQAVRDRGRSLQINCDADTAVALTERLGPDGLLFAVGCKTAGEVDHLLERLEKASA